METFEEFVKVNVPKISERVTEILAQKEEEVSKIDKGVLANIQEIAEFNSRSGKRIRGLLTLLAVKYLGKEITKEEVTVAACGEFIHAFFLIHDDIMDKSDTRRGKPSLHKLVEERFKEQANKEVIGMDVGIVSGDMLASIATNALLETTLSDAKKIELITMINDIVLHTCYGQIIDYELNYRTEKTLEDAKKVCTLKTAKYTIEGPLHLGAVLAGAPKEILEELTAFAIPLGIAFQITDDLLDIYGDEQTTGKPLYGDLREGKDTLLLAKAKELKPDAPELKNIGKKELTKEEGKQLAEFFISCGAKTFCEEEIKKLQQESLQALTTSSLPEAFKTVLEEFVAFLMQRKK